jgi:hypothetical protein
MTTGQDGYEQLMEDFGQQLQQAEARPAGAHRRRWIAAGALSVVIAAVAQSGLDGGGRLDVVAQAEAALAPAGQIVHLVTTSHMELRGGSTSEIIGAEAEENTPRVTEQWSISKPLRWRVASNVPIVTAHGSSTGPVQLSYGGGTEEFYAQPLNALNIRTGVAENSPRVSLSEGPMGSEPVPKIRAMLETGQLHDAGSGNVQGRAVRRLVGEDIQNGHSWPVEYDVDPSTFVPVRFTVEESGVSVPGNSGTLTQVVDVNTYKEIPLNESTASLLSIQPLGNPTVSRTQVGESTEPTAQSARRTGR